MESVLVLWAGLELPRPPPRVRTLPVFRLNPGPAQFRQIRCGRVSHLPPRHVPGSGYESARYTKWPMWNDLAHNPSIAGKAIPLHVRDCSTNGSRACDTFPRPQWFCVCARNARVLPNADSLDCMSPIQLLRYRFPFFICSSG